MCDIRPTTWTAFSRASQGPRKGLSKIYGEDAAEKIRIT